MNRFGQRFILYTMAGLRIRIRSIFESWIRICIKVKILELFIFLCAQNGAVEGRDAHNGGAEAQNGALEGL
jgi:hypothetical protein